MATRCAGSDMSWDLSSVKQLWGVAVVGISLPIILVSAACDGNEPVEGAKTPLETAVAVQPTDTPVSTSSVETVRPSDTPVSTTNAEGEPSTYPLFNQKLLEGLGTESVDLSDVDQVFWHIFSRLPGEVTVYPSENYYYYYIMYTDRRQIWGNIRLAAGRRERGVLSFAYFEFRETPYVTEPRVGASKFFTDADGLAIEKLDPLTFKVRYNQKEVIFHLHELSQEPPKLFTLARIHRRTALGTALEEARGCSSESGIMVLEQKPARKQGAPNGCCHRTNPTVSASSLTTIAWWPMPACSCRPP